MTRLPSLLARAACAALATLAGPPAQAQDAQDVRRAEQAVLASVTHYAAAISCSYAPLRPHDLIALVPYYLRGDNLGVGRFAVVWHGDIGCSGGANTSTTNLAIVDARFSGSFLVDAARSSPNIRFGLHMQAIDRVVRANIDTLVIDGRELGPNDALCCAADRWRVTLRSDDLGNWTEVARQRPPLANP